MVMMIFQHIMGIIAYHNETPSRRHRKMGRITPHIGRTAAIIGCLVKRHPILAIMTAAISVGLWFWERSNQKAQKVNTENNVENNGDESPK